MLKVDVGSSVPVYSQIINQIKHAIASGVLRTGDPLPSLRDMAKELKVNPNTVVKAYRELELTGLVETSPGKGTRVSSSITAFSESQRREELLKLAERIATEGYHLGASPDEIIDAVKTKLNDMISEFEDRDMRMEKNHE